MDASYRDIRDLIARVRARWRRLVVLRATIVAAVSAAVVAVTALAVAHWTGRSTTALAVTGVIALTLMLAVVVRALWPTRRVPTDLQVARFIEEREPALDDRLVSAVHVAEASKAGAAPGLADVMVADAGRRASRVDPSAIIDGDLLRRASFQSAAAVLLLLVVAFFGRSTARRSFDALSVALLPSHVRLEVSPGHARLQAGSPLTIVARLAGNTAPVAVQFQRADGDTWVPTDMPPDASGAFQLHLDSLGDSFIYRIVAGTITSPSFEVAVLRPPRVTSIDVQYRYPDGLGLQARTEEDTGDIYAPAGTDVVLKIHTDKQAAAGQMNLGGGATVALAPLDGTVLQASLRIEKDDSYRVRVSDREGMSSPGETEYFIRMLDDRPPEVRVVKPARDRSVTRLEEVDIEAEAQDDFGVEAMELVYTVRGGVEKVVPLTIPRRATSVTGSHTIFLEDLAVKPGDFVSYYVRARDLPRGRRSSESRSDIFFLEVKPFEQEFSLAQSQAGGGGGANSNPQIDDLVNAQKEVIVATWKLDRRAAANGAKSEPDIRAVAKAEGELKTRVEETASSFRESTMRDPRRRGPQPGTLRAGQTLPEEDSMTAAVKAMEKAVTSLEALKTNAAMPPELEALNHLLKAQSDVKDRQISRQTGTGGNAQNRQSQDMSSLFDKELARHQQTNYETRNSTSEQKDANSPESMLDKIHELAQRQDELLRRQQELARQRQQMTPEQLKRALETLTREQQELRQQADEMARQMAKSQPSGQQGQQQQDQQQGQQSQSGQSNQSGQPNPGGQPSQPGQQSAGQSGQPGTSGQRRDGQQQAGNGNPSGNTGNLMRSVSEEMRNAASDLQRENPGEASARGSRALEKLRDLEKQMQSSMPDEQRRALGDLQLETRQLADAQRQVSSELGRSGDSQSANDTLRRLAGEQDRLADRVQRLQENLDRQAGTPSPSDRAGSPKAGGQDAGASKQAAADASRDLKQQRLSERMRQSADDMRAAAGADGKQGSTRQSAKSNAASQQELARSLDRLADRLGTANGARDQESKKLSDQLAKAQELRDQMDATSRQLAALGQQAGQRGAGQAPGTTGGDEASKLRDEYSRQLKETQSLLDELRREERTTGRGDGGLTFEGQGMVLSAPGTEAFKQDFAKWEELRKQATQALEVAESNLSQKLQAKASKDRLASGVDDKPPAAYSQQVDSYFKALAGKRTR